MKCVYVCNLELKIRGELPEGGSMDLAQKLECVLVERIKS